MSSTLVLGGVGYVNIHKHVGILFDIVETALGDLTYMDEYAAGTLTDIWAAIAPRERHALKCVIRNAIRDGAKPVHLLTILDLDD